LLLSHEYESLLKILSDNRHYFSLGHKLQRIMLIVLCCVVQEDSSDCGRACGLTHPTVLSVALLTALTFAVTVLLVGDDSDIQ